ncbi:MAG: glycosyltransferase family 39 protein [Longimicrobiales bacterium]|nr:glycosyltransferase family 39 protein [Longimicrobiales bacterium]
MRWLLLGQIAILAALNFLRGLGGSLWLDESLTWWAASGSLEQVVFRSVEYQGQNPFFYLIVWPMVQIFGESEVALRLPSRLFLLLSTFFVYRLGRTLLDGEAGLLAALLFQALWAIRFGPPDARTYPLAVCLLILSTLFLVRWEQGRARAAWGYVAAILGSIYAHVLLAPALLVHAAYLVAGEGIKTRLREWFGPALALVLGAVPILALVLFLRGKWALYSFAPMPSPGDLLAAWKAVPIALMLCATIYLLGGAGRYVRWRRPGLHLRDHVLFWSWALLPALILFALSHLRELSVFVHRYHVWQVPGIALLVTGLVVGFRQGWVRMAFSGLYFAAALTVLVLRPGGGNEDWRAAVAHVNGAIESGGTPVLVWSGLVESRDVAWLRAAESRSYVLAPASFYRLEGRVVPVPQPSSIDGLEAFLSPSEADEVRSAPALWVLTRDSLAARDIASWARTRGAKNPVLTRFGGVTVARVALE